MCVLVCRGGGLGYDGNKHWHWISDTGAGGIVSIGVNSGVAAGSPNYVNGGSASVSCSISTPIGGFYGEGGWDDSTLDKPLTLPNGGGGGVSVGAGEGCGVIHSYTSEGW